MTSLIEIGKDQQCLVWQPHLLTEAMESRRWTDLMLEPVVNPGGGGAASVKIDCNDVSVKWVWGNWNRVEIGAANTEASGAARTYTRSQHSEAKWKELPAVRDVELTFYGAEGLTARAKVEVPDVANLGRDVEFGQRRNGMVRVRLLNSKVHTNVTVELLRLSMESVYKPRGRPFPLQSGTSQASVPVPHDFFGVLAVVANRNGQRRLIGAADFDDRGRVTPQSPGDDELKKVRRWVESGVVNGRQAPRLALTAEEWLDNWPDNSRERLASLYQLARRHLESTGVAGADDLLRACPTGLARYLTLTQCGYESFTPQNLIRQLNGGSFQSALNTELPVLSKALAVLNSPVERIWAIEHADNRNLAEVAASVRDLGIAALARELHLFDRRSEAIAAWEARR
jgi:hypothetical protein